MWQLVSSHPFLTAGFCLVVSFLLILVGAIGFVLIKQQLLWSKMNHLEGIGGLRAHLRLFSQHKFERHRVLIDLVPRFGKIFRWKLVVVSAACSADPEVLKLVWSTKNFPKSEFYDKLSALVGENLLTESGDKWRVHRKLMQGGFLPQQFGRYLPVFQRVADQLCDAVQREAITAAGSVVRMDTLLQRATLDIIAASSLRFELDCLTGRNQDVVGAFNEVLHSIASPLLLLPGGPRLIRFLHRAAFAKIDRIIYECIANGRSDPPRPDEAPRDLLDALLGARDETGRRMSDTELRNQLLLFFIAGHDTASLTVSYTLYLLARHPDCMQRAVEEVDRVCGGATPTAEHTQALVYVTQCMKEALRIYPPIVLASRQLTEDLHVDGVTVPKGTMFSSAIHAMHHRPDIYPNPEQFDPDRFREDVVATRHPFAFSPFTHGPRICIGMNFAWLEGRVLLARLLQRFRFEYAGTELIASTATELYKPVNGVMLRAVPRAS